MDRKEVVADKITIYSVMIFGFDPFINFKIPKTYLLL